MARYLSTNALIDSVKRRAMLPETTNTFKEEDFLAFANEEMDIGIVPHILSFHEDYLLFSEDVPLESNISRYQIPNRAIGNKLREMSYKDVSNTIFEMTRIFIEDVPYFQYGPMGSVSGPLKAFYTEANEVVLMPEMDSSTSGNLRMSYYIRPNQLVSEDRVTSITDVDYNKGLLYVTDIPDNFMGTSSFDITSSKAPFKLLGKDLVPNDYGSSSQLVYTFGTVNIYTIQCLAFADIVDASYIYFYDSMNSSTAATHVFWFDKTGSTPAPTVNGTLHRVDISAAVTATQVATALSAAIAAYDPVLLTVSSLADTVTVQSAGAKINVGDNFEFSAGITLFTIVHSQVGTNTLPRNITENDIFALSEETIIPQIPVELHSMLAQRIAIRCLEALGDMQGLQMAMAKLAEMEVKTGSIIDDRVEGSPLKVAPKHTFLRQSRNYLRR